MASDVKRPFLLQLGSSQDELCKPRRLREEPQKTKKSLNNCMNRSSLCSQESSASSSSSNTNNEVSSPSLILPYLYVGDQAQTQIDTISNLNISYILSLQSLPKFLSSSPPSTPPQTLTATPLSPSPGGGDIIVRPVKLHKSPSVGSVLSLSSTNKTKGLTPSSQQAGVDIIDGADGGLLPSANSSKDYLVKIEHMSQDGEGGSTSQQQSSVNLGAKPTANGIDKSQPMEVDDDIAPQACCQINCDIGSSGSSDSQESSDADDDETQDRDSALKDCFLQTTSSEQNIETEEAFTSSDVLQEVGCVATTSSCSLKQKCNRLSSSVHRLIKGKCINISDTFEQLLDKFFDETHNFIEEARRNKCNVLVHCKAGISRSPTIAIAYLMKWKRLHLQDAYNLVKRCRPQISPNLNFMGQLVSYERQLQRDRSHLPSPTSSCLPSFSMSCGQQQLQLQQQQQQHQQHLTIPGKSSSSTLDTQSAHHQARTKNVVSSNEAEKVHLVPRVSNRNSVDTISYDSSNNKRAKVRCFFRRK